MTLQPHFANTIPAAMPAAPTKSHGQTDSRDSGITRSVTEPAIHIAAAATRLIATKSPVTVRKAFKAARVTRNDTGVDHGDD